MSDTILRRFLRERGETGASIGDVCAALPASTTAEAARLAGVTEERIRKLPAKFTALMLTISALSPGLSFEDAAKKALEGARFVGGYDTDLGAAGAGAICMARYKYGPLLMVKLFGLVGKRMATPATPDACLFGRMMVAIDGTVESVADSPENVKAFGRKKGRSGESGFPQIKCVYICECGTHAIFGVVVRPGRCHDVRLGRMLVKLVESSDLVLLDRGFFDYDMIHRILQRDADVLIRAKSNSKLAPIRTLSDGAWLAEMRSSSYRRRKEGGKIVFRVIQYSHPDPKDATKRITSRLVTSLLDEKLYPAKELIAAYHKRWEIEITIDEIDTHMRQEKPIVRSRKPAGVVQEVYAALTAHWIVRKIMFDAAETIGIAPTRLSFVKSLRLIRDALPTFDALPPERRDERRRALLRDVAANVLPPRRCRNYPRVVKRKMSKFRVKRRSIHGPQVKTTPFMESVVCAPGAHSRP